MKNRHIIKILIYLLPLLILVGFSSWVIIYTIVIEPIYISNKVTEEYDIINSVAYNGLPQIPISNNGIYDNSTITFRYRKYGTKDEYLTISDDVKGPTEVGEYDFIITVPDGETKVKFTIRKNQLSLYEDIIQLDYNNKTWQLIEIDLESKVKLIDEYGTIIEDKPLNILSIYNGIEEYSSSRIHEKVSGSTYSVIYELQNTLEKNYIVPDDFLIFKYKSVDVGGILYTIEDAILNQNGKITVKGSTSDTYITSFCNLSKDQGYPYENFTTDSINFLDKRVFKIKNGNTLYIPHSTNAEKPDYTVSTDEYHVNEANHVFSALIIPDSVALVFETKSYLTISGVLGSLGSIGTHGVVMNNGIISIEKNSVLNAIGFLKGSGDVILKKDSITYDVLRIFDWIGGTNLMKNFLLDKSLPITSWSFHNISSPTKIMSGAELKGHVLIYANNTAYQIEVSIVGKNEASSGCLFEPNTNSSSNDYIYKYSKSTPTSNLVNENIFAYNQKIGVIDYYEIHGQYKDESFSLSLQGFSFATSPNICMNMPYSNVILKDDPSLDSNTKLVLDNSSYVFMVGTYCVVEENTELVIGVKNSVYMGFDTLISSGNTYSSTVCNYFTTGEIIYGDYDIADEGDGFVGYYGMMSVIKESAYLKVNGTISGVGMAGGKVITSTSGAQLQLQKYVVSSIKIKNSNNNHGVTKENYALIGSIANDNSYTPNSPFQTGVFYTSSTKNNQDYYFIPNTDLKTFKLNLFILNDDGSFNEDCVLLESKFKYVGSIDVNGEKKYLCLIYGSEFSPTKKHYSLLDWGLIDPVTKDKISLMEGLEEEIIIEYDTNNEIIDGQIKYNKIDFYCEFEPVEYTINYTAGLKNSSSDEIEDFSEQFIPDSYISSFTIEDFTVENSGKIELPIPYKLFNEVQYWFLGNKELHYDESITYLTKAIVEEYISISTGNIINLYCEYNQKNTYTITFQNNNNENFGNIGPISDGEVIKLPTSTFDNLSDKEFYLEGFYLDHDSNTGEYTNKLNTKDFVNSGSLFDEMFFLNGNYVENSVITLYLNYEPKAYRIEYRNKEVDSVTDALSVTDVLAKQYFNSLQNIQLNNGTYYDQNKAETVNFSLADRGFTKEEKKHYYHVSYTFAGWNSSLEVKDSPDYPYSGKTTINLSSIDENNKDGNVTIITLYAHYSEYNYNIISASSIAGSTNVWVDLNNNNEEDVNEKLGTNNPIKVEYNNSITINIYIKEDSKNNFDNKGNYSYSIISDNFTNDKLPSVSGELTTTTIKESFKITMIDDLVVETIRNGGTDNCIPSGTLITLSDGTKKKVEDLALNDRLLVFNHVTGMFENSPIVFIDDDGWKEYDIINLVFSNGNITKLIYEHGYFNITLNKYVYITEYNYKEYIGHEFVTTDGEKISSVTLVDSYITTEYVGCYSPVTAVHLNYIVDGMLSMPGGVEGIFNIFEYDENLKYDEELMNKDIEEYGIMEYEVLAPYVPYEMYVAFNAKYFNVAIGKGMITLEKIIDYAERYLKKHGLLE